METKKFNDIDYSYDENRISNIIRFPNNILEPRQIIIDNETYTLFTAKFKNLYDLYDYLTGNPTINRCIFNKLHSETNDSDFAGKPYKEAVEDLNRNNVEGYDEFLQLQKDIQNAKLGDVHKFKTVSSLAGGRVNIPAYSAGSPYCYTTEEKIQLPKFITLNVNLSYSGRTTKNQVLNKAIIITNLVKALEHAGYNVNINTFELSYVDDEISKTIVELKQHSGKLHMSDLYKTLCSVEFLRRILFRILETLEVENEWSWGYGHVCSEDFTRKVMKIDKNDILFTQPYDMGIHGKDLAEDFENAITHLELENIIDVDKAKKIFSSEEMKLKLSKRMN